MSKSLPKQGQDAHANNTLWISKSISRIRNQPQLSGNHRSLATALARRLASKYRTTSLRFTACYHTPIGKQYLFQQIYGDLPVSGGWVKVTIDGDGIATDATISLARIPSSRGRGDVKTSLGPAERSVRIARSVLQTRHELACDPEAVSLRTENGFRPAWKLIMTCQKSKQSHKLYVDGESMVLVKSVPLFQRIAGTGAVFDPNPIVTLNRWDLSPSTNLPPSVYSIHPLLGLDNSGYLVGDWVRIIRSDGKTPVKRSNGNFLFQRSDPGFTEVMAYHHVDRAQRYIQSFGLANLGNRQTSIDVAASAADGSFFDPQTGIIRLGTGGIPDAQDAELILHEYGHAIQAHAIPGFGLGIPSSELAEGFCDYFAASFFEGLKSDALKPCVASWNALGKAPPIGNPPTLRRLDRSEPYTHASPSKREIWSSCLWKLRQEVLGRRAADLCILGSHYYLGGPLPTPYEFAIAILKANRYFNQGTHEDGLVQAFRSRAIFS